MNPTSSVTPAKSHNPRAVSVQVTEHADEGVLGQVAHLEAVGLVPSDVRDVLEVGRERDLHRAVGVARLGDDAEQRERDERRGEEAAGDERGGALEAAPR